MTSNPSRFQFYAKWLRLAFSKPVGVATTISGILSILIGAARYFWPDLLSQVSVFIWACPIAVFVVLFILGFFNAPFVLYQELNTARLEESKAKDQRIASYEGRLQKAEEVNEPLEIEGFRTALLDGIKEHYEAEGRIVAYPRLTQKDEYIAKGFELAYQPGTSREVWIGTGRRSDRNIMMLKPKTG